MDVVSFSRILAIPLPAFEKGLLLSLISKLVCRLVLGLDSEYRSKLFPPPLPLPPPLDEEELDTLEEIVWKVFERLTVAEPKLFGES